MYAGIILAPRHGKAFSTKIQEVGAQFQVTTELSTFLEGTKAGSSSVGLIMENAAPLLPYLVSSIDIGVISKLYICSEDKDIVADELSKCPRLSDVDVLVGDLYSNFKREADVVNAIGFLSEQPGYVITDRTIPERTTDLVASVLSEVMSNAQFQVPITKDSSDKTLDVINKAHNDFMEKAMSKGSGVSEDSKRLVQETVSLVADGIKVKGLRAELGETPVATGLDKDFVDFIAELKLESIADDEDKLRDALSLVRAESAKVEEQLESITGKLRDYKAGIESISLCPNKELLGYINGVSDKPELRDTLTAIVSHKQVVRKDLDLLQADYADTVTSITTQMINVQETYRTVVSGYESVVDGAFTLISKLKMGSSINIEVADKVAANLIVVTGREGSGVTAYAVNSAAHNSKTQPACCLDLRLKNPQLHHYSMGVDLSDLLNKTQDEVTTVLSEALENNSNFLVITNTKGLNLLKIHSPKEVIAFVKNLLSILCLKLQTQVFAITSSQETPVLKRVVMKETISVAYVTDCDIGKQMDIHTDAMELAYDTSLRLRYLIVNQISELKGSVFVEKIGVDVSKFSMIEVPLLPMSSHKFATSIYALSGVRWGYSPC